jgi:protein-disulfide isomerase
VVRTVVGRFGVVVVAAVLAACSAAPAPAIPPSNEAPAPVGAEPGAQYVGNPAAEVVLVYWFDYECVHCVAFAPTLDKLERAFGDRIVVYYKNFQLAKHPAAHDAAVAAEAARRQGKFIEMHRVLMATSPRFEASALRAQASSLELDLDRFDADLADPTAAAAIDREYAEGEAADLWYVPVLFINGIEYVGDFELTRLSAAIDAALDEA